MSTKLNGQIPKLIGIEIEFGNHIRKPDSSKDDNDTCGAAQVLCHAHKELFGLSADDKNGCQSGLDEFGVHQFRFYQDHYHSEISSPLAADAKDLVLWQRRAKKLARCCQKWAEKNDVPVRLHCATTNRFGAAWAFHLNSPVSRATFDEWRDKKWHPLFAQWLPFLVTSPILFGTGKVGSENDRPAASYQLSQRADFVEKEVDLETVSSKSLINERDEPLADPNRYARFHITAAFDFNCCEFASWLKFGTVQIMLALIEAGAKLPNLQLKDPLHSLATVSRDLEMSTMIELEDSSYLTAIEIQEALAFSANRSISAGVISEEVVPSATEIVNAWIITLLQLRKRAPILRRRLDWIVKKKALDKWRQRLGVSWNDMAMTELDLRYAEIETGWFEKLERQRMVDRLEDFLPINDVEHKTNSSERDIVRGRILEKFSQNVVAVDWHYVCIDLAKDGAPVIYKVELDDPLDATEVQRAVDAAQTAREFVKCLSKTCCHRVECGGREHSLLFKPVFMEES